MTDTATAPARTDSATVCPLTGPHRHGSSDDHRTGCRCPDTMRAHRLRLGVQARRARLVAMGVAEYDVLVDPGPARERVEQWLTDGVLAQHILRGTGIPQDTLGRIRRREGMIRKSTAEAILAWTPAPAHRVKEHHVPALGTMRRLRALAALGHTTAAIAALIAPLAPPDTVPTSATTLSRIRAGTRTATTPRVRTEVIHAYDTLWDRQPPGGTHAQVRAAGRARSLATEGRWPAPMYLDDDRMEDPSYHPRTPYGPRTTD